MTDILFHLASQHLKRIAPAQDPTAKPAAVPPPASTIHTDPDLAAINRALTHTGDRINTALVRANSQLRVEVQESAAPPRVNVVFSDHAQPAPSRVWNTLSVYRREGEVTVMPIASAHSLTYAFTDPDEVKMAAHLSGHVVGQVIDRLGPNEAPAFVNSLKNTKRASDRGGGPI